VLKNDCPERSRLGREHCGLPEFFFGGLQLSRRGQVGLWRLAEEPDQSFDVVGGRCEEEFLANEHQSKQAQATQSDLILQFCEQRFHLLSLPLCVREARRVCQVSGALPGRLMHVDGKILQR
jgi:hypothetical protein